jgi:hypothetical protein
MKKPNNTVHPPIYIGFGRLPRNRFGKSPRGYLSFDVGIVGGYCRRKESIMGLYSEMERSMSGGSKCGNCKFLDYNTCKNGISSEQRKANNYQGCFMYESLVNLSDPKVEQEAKDRHERWKESMEYL